MAHPTTSPTDQSCWDAFRSGDKAAFEILYKRYFNALYDYGMRLTQAEELTVDCLQDFFLYLWNHRANLGHARSVKFYLISSFRRRLFRQLNKERNLQYRKDEFSVQQTSEDVPEESRIILAEDEDRRSRAVKTLLTQISPRQREVLYLRYFKGLSPREISETIGLNYQTVVNHLCEGIKSLRKQDLSMMRPY